MIGLTKRATSRDIAVSAREPVAPAQPLTVNVDERRIGRTLLSIAAVLVAVGGASRLADVYLPDFPGRDFVAGLFRLDAEANLPTLYSTLLLLAAALGFAAIGRVKAQVRDPFTRVWWGLCWVFVFLGVDECAQLHERPAEFIKGALGAGGFLTYAWVIPYALLTAGIFVLLVRFLKHLPAVTRNALLAAGFMYVMGAMGCELMEAKFESVFPGSGAEHPGYIALVTLEEALEMSGVIVLIVTLITYWRRFLPGAAITVTPSRAAAPGRGT